MTTPHEPPLQAAPGRRRARHVLLIDDDPAFQAHTAYLMSQAGHRVTIARERDEGVQQVERCCSEGDQFDLLIVDLDLSGEGLPHFLSQIRTLRIPTPVLVLANFFDPVRLSELRSLACPDVMLKSRIESELLGYLDQLNATTHPEDRRMTREVS
jgi:DNA-binding NarL/FixJ family response regulator